MGVHPNVLLVASLTPDKTTRKTYRDILASESIEKDAKIKISGAGYSHSVMEDDYLSSYQISSKEGDIVVFDFVTYGYGDTIKWSDIERKKEELEEWCKAICEKHQCTYLIFVTANYW